MKRLIAAMLSLVLLVTTMFSLGGCSISNKSSNVMTMGKWLTLIADYFGMESFTQETPYCKNVSTSDDCFDAFQMAVEWDIIEPSDEVLSTDIITWRDALITVVNAGEFVQSSETDESKINYAIDTFDTSIRKYWMNRSIDCESALILLAKAQNKWANKKYTKTIDSSKYKETVVDLTKETEYQVNNGTIAFPKSSEVNVGNILVLKSNENSFEKEFYKVEDVENLGSDKIASISSDVKMEDIYDEIYTEGTIIPSLDNTVIYDGNGNLISGEAGNNFETQSYVQEKDASISTLEYKENLSQIQNCAATVSKEFTVNGCEIGLSYQSDGALDLKISVKSNNLLNNSDNGELKFAEEFEVSNLAVTHKFDWGFLSLKSAELKIDYTTKNKFEIGYSTREEAVAAPAYSNGNGKFLTNFKRAVFKSADGKGAKTIASKKTVKVCSLNVYSVGVAKICLDVNLALKVDGSVSLTVTESGSKGVEYKNGNIRFVKTCNNSAEAQVKAKIELTIGFGPSLYVVGLKKRLVGIEATLGVGASASLNAHLADSQMHLIEELDFGDTSSEVAESYSGAFANISATGKDIQAVAEAQGGIFEAQADAEIKLHIDFCINVNVYGIVRIGITDEAYLTDILGDKAKLSVDIKNEKNHTFFNIHVDNFDWINAVLSYGISNASKDNCTLNYVPFEHGSDEPVTDEDIAEHNSNILSGDTLILSTMNVSMDIGQTYLVNVSQLPKDYTISDIIFESKDSKIASVDSNGVITAIGEGCTIVSACTSDGKYKALISTIVQTKKAQNFEGLNYSFTIGQGDDLQLC